MENDKLKVLKKELLKKGFIIEGVVGSFARGGNYNDIDIVYSVNKDFLRSYKGFRAVIEIENIKKFLEKELKKSVDLIAKNSMTNTAKKYMLKDFVNV